MPKIVPLVEGPGDVDAVPGLVYRILHKNECWTWHVARPKKVRGLSALKKRLSDFMTYAQRDVNGGGILILLDLDDGCPKIEASKLAKQVREFNLTCPVAVVFAHREYETWFLASLNSLIESGFLPQGLLYIGDIEAKRDVKAWLTQQMPSGRAYKETIHQKIFTSSIDLNAAYQNSRSFRRLCGAVEELVRMSGSSQRGQVTPSPC